MDIELIDTKIMNGFLGRASSRYGVPLEDTRQDFYVKWLEVPQGCPPGLAYKQVSRDVIDGFRTRRYHYQSKSTTNIHVYQFYPIGQQFGLAADVPTEDEICEAIDTKRLIDSLSQFAKEFPILELWLQGMTYKQIGGEYGICESYAWKKVQSALKKWRKQCDSPAIY